MAIRRARSRSRRGCQAVLEESAGIDVAPFNIKRRREYMKSKEPGRPVAVLLRSSINCCTTKGDAIIIRSLLPAFTGVQMVSIYFRRCYRRCRSARSFFQQVRRKPSRPTVAVTLFNNVRVFDGKGAALSEPTNVLVRGKLIERISRTPIPVDRMATTTIIDGGGRTLMPGLIDAHWHAMLMRATPAESFGDVGYNNLMAGDEATDTLMRGFTTVRDVGGPVFGLKRAIDEGIVKGPRIYPSGAMITVTSGHGDFRQLTDLPRTIGGMLTRMEQVGGSMVADSPDEVRLRAREQLMQGASQVKVTAGGGVSSPFSPIDVSTFTEPELRAAVEAAENWGTYVAAHAFTPAAIQRLDRGGRQLHRTWHADGRGDRKLMADKGIWLSMQPLP